MTKARSSWLALLGLAGLALGCGGTPETPDATSGNDAHASTCTTDTDCDDGHFCDGPEHCMPHDPGADARGCIATPPCTDSQRCDEAMRRCVTSCAVDADADGDGADAIACGGTDCDDADANRHPGNPEVCDATGHDEDCDPTTFGVTDADGDGFTSAACCNTAMDGTMHCGDDCDDHRNDSHPGATEACEGIDNDCDHAVDEGLLVNEFPDLDFDLHGASDATMARMVCPGTPGWSTVGDDCDDTSSVRYTGFVEICDTIDNDCDGMVDEAPSDTTWYPDQDGDGFGAVPSDPSMLRVACIPPGDGYSVRSSDCNDMDAHVHPGAPEACNGRDDDCNGLADAPGTSAGDTEDDDHDGFGDVVCGANDCNDAVASIHPHAMELCNMIDDDCDGVVDGASAMAAWYLDLDHDGFGDVSSVPIMSCDPQPSRVVVTGDCDDSTSVIHPDATDLCDGIDEDCDGQIDESGVRFAFYPDADADGWGTTDQSAVLFRCTAPTGTSGLSGDCADTNPMIHPSAPEQCNSIDDDCDTTVDEDSMQSWYLDVDHDGHGAGAALVACIMPAGRVTLGDDCDDADAANFPGNPEVCDGRDNDCDGTVDDGASAACMGLPNSTGACTSGACVLTCAGGFSDCDGVLASGCEVDTAHSALFCGSCSTPCHPADTCGTTSAGTCDLSPIVGLNGSDGYVLALRASGGVAVWGQGFDAQTTFGADLARPTGTSLTGIVRLDGGINGHACALTSAHVALCWGRNDYGQLGSGGTSGHGPAPVPLTDVVSISAGSFHTCAVLGDGTVWCFGANGNGQLGDGTTMQRSVPTQVLGITDAVEVTAGLNYTCARRGSAGAYVVTCWGVNTGGAIGIGSTGGPDVLSPSANVVGLPTNVIGFAEQSVEGTCARTSDGRAFCWGGNSSALVLGLGGSAGAAVPTATQIPGLAGVIEVTLGSVSGCAIVRGSTANELWCWGQQTLSTSWINGTTNAQYTPVLMTGFPDPVAVTVGNAHACAALRPGGVTCVGQDSYGQLGDGGTLTASSTPVAALSLP